MTMNDVNQALKPHGLFARNWSGGGCFAFAIYSTGDVFECVVQEVTPGCGKFAPDPKQRLTKQERQYGMAAAQALTGLDLRGAR